MKKLTRTLTALGIGFSLSTPHITQDAFAGFFNSKQKKEEGVFGEYGQDNGRSQNALNSRDKFEKNKKAIDKYLKDDLVKQIKNSIAIELKRYDLQKSSLNTQETYNAFLINSADEIYTELMKGLPIATALELGGENAYNVLHHDDIAHYLSKGQRKEVYKGYLGTLIKIFQDKVLQDALTRYHIVTSGGEIHNIQNRYNHQQQLIKQHRQSMAIHPQHTPQSNTHASRKSGWFNPVDAGASSSSSSSDSLGENSSMKQITPSPLSAITSNNPTYLENKQPQGRNGSFSGKKTAGQEQISLYSDVIPNPPLYSYLTQKDLKWDILKLNKITEYSATEQDSIARLSAAILRFDLFNLTIIEEALKNSADLLKKKYLSEHNKYNKVQQAQAYLRTYLHEHTKR